jgi:hypothetical protein
MRRASGEKWSISLVVSIVLLYPIHDTSRADPFRGHFSACDTELGLGAHRYHRGPRDGGLNVEKHVVEGLNVTAPFDAMAQHRGSGLVKTYVVLVAVPLTFAALYLALLIISIYAASGHF